MWFLVVSEFVGSSLRVEVACRSRGAVVDADFTGITILAAFRGRLQSLGSQGFRLRVKEKLWNACL